jgi:hypothetical protein
VQTRELWSLKDSAAATIGVDAQSKRATTHTDSVDEFTGVLAAPGYDRDAEGREAQSVAE